MKSARYRARHLERRRAQDRAIAARRRAKDPELANAKNREWANENRERFRELVRNAGARYRIKNKEAIKEIGKRWRTNNPGIVRAAVLRRNFGIAPLQLAAAIYFQGERCAICRDRLRLGEKKQKSTVHVDHCHRTGRFRGVLCVGCNSAIGKLNDDPCVLERAASYVRNGGPS